MNRLDVEDMLSTFADSEGLTDMFGAKPAVVVDEEPIRRRIPYGELKRGKHLASKKSFLAAQELERVPDVIEDRGPNAIGFSPHLLRSPLFGAGSNKWHLENWNRCERGATTMPSGRSSPFEYRGPPLNADHGLVLFYLLSLARGSDFVTPVKLRPRRFAHEMLGWADSKHSVRRLAVTLKQLVSAQVTRDWNAIRHECPVTIGFVLDYWADGRDVCVVLNPKLAHTLRGYLTFVRLSHLRRLSTNIAKWLYLFICASDCKDWLSLTSLRELYGTMQPVSVFGRNARTALGQLKQSGLIDDFHARRGAVYITKRRGKLEVEA